MTILPEKLIIEPVSTIPFALWAGKQGYYQHVARFQETKPMKTETVSFYIYKSKKQSVKIKFLCNIAQRWKQHCKCGLGIDASVTNKLYNAMQEHGVWNFTFELIEECPRNLLNEKEKFWIEAFESNKYGHYNSTGGNK